jgi:hypothetical protein
MFVIGEICRRMAPPVNLRCWQVARGNEPRGQGPADSQNGLKFGLGGGVQVN